MYKVGDKLTLIKNTAAAFDILYTLGNTYKILNVKGDIYYLETDDKSAIWKDWGIWTKVQLDANFKNLRDERLKKLKQINESNIRQI